MIDRPGTLLSLLILLGACNSVWCQNWEVFDMANSPMPSTTVNAMADDGVGGIWAGTDWGLAHRDITGTWEIFQTANSDIPSNFITCLASDSTVLWVGTQSNGMARWDGTEWTTFTTDNSLVPEDGIRDLFVDHRHWVWVTTAGGLAAYTGSEWLIYNSTDLSYSGLMLNTSSTNCVAVREDGTICLGTINGGLHFLTDTTVFFLTIPQNGFFDNTATDVLFDPVNGERWVSTPSAGLLRQQGPVLGGVWYQWSIATGFPTNGISAVAMDVERRVWCATQSVGAVRVEQDGTHVQLNQATSGLPDNELRSVMATSTGDVWVGMTYGGLARYVDNVGFEQVANRLQIGIFPNPTTDQCMVQLGARTGMVTWTLTAADGKVVQKGLKMGPDLELHLAGNEPGAYILEVVDGGRVQHGRIVVL